uniref:E3 ubiquitin-protein ligase RNF144A isoform X2 n=1 Tax=Erigeron canadensis TaxID=72917 RepID=UPI001CB8FD8A|nr:E3 ubiquitin-protein ligase RNF144A isoform X2 [Erigeron canadensis]
MAASSSTSSDHHHNIVDEQYFSALHDNDELFPISDAEELQLQEALIHSSSSAAANLIPSSSASSSTLNENEDQSSLVLLKNKQPLLLVESKTVFLYEPLVYCGICMDSKTESEMFRNTNVCSHVYCTDCICQHVAAMIKENSAMVKCPDPNCTGVIGPQVCQGMVPKQVLERWEDVLCESLIMGSDKFIYCPFKDCSAMLVDDDDAGVAVTSSECPSCNRLFCAQCRVAWHCGLDCSEYKNGEREPEDLMLMDLAKTKKWMRCPSCKVFVERTSGCPHISCRCGHHFCYECGKQNDGTTHTCAHY